MKQLRLSGTGTILLYVLQYMCVFIPINTRIYQSIDPADDNVHAHKREYIKYIIRKLLQTWLFFLGGNLSTDNIRYGHKLAPIKEVSDLTTARFS